MFFIWDKKAVVLVGLGLAILIGGWWLTRGGFFLREKNRPVEVDLHVKKDVPKPSGGDLEKAEFFVDCRLARDRIRSQRIEVLKEIAANPTSDSENRSRAQQELMSIMDQAVKETELEQMVVAEGFKDAVVMIQEKSATVIVQGRSLTSADKEKIRDIVARVVSIEPGNVLVMAKL
ncbi:stage III sporulation protein AH [Thermacetogenium phaeum DSM 12270]|jgi:stage III sporulation protein AH|uniref:Stage III sporulation protein AH n=2 Tax=Thermacetogenium phaeum TaxID=85874 RepID=K4LUZ5_THEPS|nr:SpoIIIAH-like family protein [Thermacetogenium phaeum]AFV11844.1 stage III sporulation protein AH [Thermacetogenium phaeum DSM 12270]KUK36351.1 MAG: Stage III sporulation protein AH [Thermacetogenium phaeum]MDK2880679.1 stage sporulation protein [Clostridia bacterium]MDN5376149.1 stage sporulation protein [Thermacetogenium sp.]